MLQVKNMDDEILEVTSLDIRPVYERMMDEEEGVRPIMPLKYEHYDANKKGQNIGVPIVKLSRNQEVNVRFDVQKGIAKMHSKWSPVSLATFQPDPTVKIDESIELNNEQKVAIRDCCPAKVFEIQENVFEVAYPEKCILCDECVKTANMQNLKNFVQIGMFLIIVQGRRKIATFSRWSPLEF